VRSLGVKQDTAWHMAHRIRFAIQAGTLEVMSGQVEADETVLGGQPKFMHEDKRLDHKDRGYPKIGTTPASRQTRNGLRLLLSSASGLPTKN